MNTKMGYVIITDPENPTIERDAYTCAHCQKICIVRPGSGTRRGYCANCDALTCGGDDCSTRCIPLEAKLEAWEGRRSFWRQMAVFERKR